MKNSDQWSVVSDRFGLSKSALARALFVAFSFLLIAVASPAQQSKPWEKIPIPPLKEFKPQQPKRIALKNGIVIFLQEDHELPFVSGSVLIPGGSRDEDPAKCGLISLYGQTWRTSGSTKRWTAMPWTICWNRKPRISKPAETMTRPRSRGIR